MYVKPTVNAARFRENLAAAIAARGQDAAQVAERAGVDRDVMRDLMMTGRPSDALVAVLADYLDIEPREFAPLIDLRDPDRRDRLPAEGRDVPETLFWHHRIADGDVVVARPSPPPTTDRPVVARRAAPEVHASAEPKTVDAIERTVPRRP